MRPRIIAIAFLIALPLLGAGPLAAHLLTRTAVDPVRVAVMPLPGERD